MDNSTILKQTGATLKEDTNTINEKTSGVLWPPSIHKRDKDSKKPLEIILNFNLFIISFESLYQSGASDSNNLLLISFSEDFIKVFMGSSLM